MDIVVGMGPDNREGPRGAVRIMRMIIGSRGGGLMAAADQRPGASLLQIICDTGAKPGIYGLPFSIGNQLSTDYSGTVGPIIMNLSAAPRDLKFDFDLMLKKHHPYSTSLLAAFALRA